MSYQVVYSLLRSFVYLETQQDVTSQVQGVGRMMNVICEEFGSTSRGKAWCGTWVMLREVVGLYELQPAVKSTLGVIGRLLELPSSESEKSNSEDT